MKKGDKNMKRIALKNLQAKEFWNKFNGFIQDLPINLNDDERDSLQNIYSYFRIDNHVLFFKYEDTEEELTHKKATEIIGQEFDRIFKKISERKAFVEIDKGNMEFITSEVGGMFHKYATYDPHRNVEAEQIAKAFLKEARLVLKRGNHELNDKSKKAFEEILDVLEGNTVETRLFRAAADREGTGSALDSFSEKHVYDAVKAIGDRDNLTKEEKESINAIVAASFDIAHQSQEKGGRGR